MSRSGTTIRPARTDRRAGLAPSTIRTVTDRLPIALTLVALLLRLVWIRGGHDFWFDEGLEILRARVAWPGILTLREGPDPPIYRLLLALPARLTSNELWLRLPSALSSVAAVWLAYVWIARRGDRRLALLTMALLAFSPVQVHYAQEVSQYALAGLLGVALLLTFDGVIDRGSDTDWAAATVVSTLALGTYYGLVFLIAPLNLVLASRLLRNGHRRSWVRFAILNAFLLGTASLLFAFMLREQAEKFTGDTLIRWFGNYPLAATAEFLRVNLVENVLRFFWIPWSDAAPPALLALPAALLAIGTVDLWRRGPAGRRPLLVFALSLTLMWIAHGLGFYPFGFRYGLFLCPLYFLIVAAGLRSLWRWPALGAVALGATLATFVFFLPNLRLLPNPWLSPPHENLGRVLEHVRREALPGDAIYVYYGALPSFRVYRRPGDPEAIEGDPIRQLPPADKVESVRRAVADRPRFWLVLSHIHGDEKDVLLQGLTSGDGAREVLDSRSDVNAFAALLGKRSP